MPGTESAANYSFARLSGIDLDTRIDGDELLRGGEERLPPVRQFALDLVKIEALCIIILVKVQGCSESLTFKYRAESCRNRNIITIERSIQVDARLIEANIQS